MEWKPGCPIWIVEDGSPNAEKNRQKVLEKLVTEDYKLLPSEDMVKSWHSTMFEDIAPCKDYLGHFRDKELTTYCLQDYDVIIGDYRGTPYGQVLDDVAAFFRVFNNELAAIEKTLPFDTDRELTTWEVTKIVKLAALVHGEWVRIHPFANGNGRTARLLANYVLVRYGFGPALAIRPRPSGEYGRAAHDSMNKDHRRMENLIWHLLAESYISKEKDNN
jgi:fido (protein-threonine AMPylation protein)